MILECQNKILDPSFLEFYPPTNKAENENIFLSGDPSNKLLNALILGGIIDDSYRLVTAPSPKDEGF